MEELTIPGSGEIKTGAFFTKLKAMGFSWGRAEVRKNYLSFTNRGGTGDDMYAPEDSINSIGVDEAILAGSVIAGLKDSLGPVAFLLKLAEQAWLYRHGMPVIPENIATML